MRAPATIRSIRSTLTAIPVVLGITGFAILQVGLAPPGVAATPALSVAVEVPSASVVAGDAGVYELVLRQRARREPVRLSIAGLPPGARARFEALGGGRYRVVVQTSPTMATVTATATVVARSASATARAAFRLSVTARPVTGAPTPTRPTVPPPAPSPPPVVAPAPTVAPAPVATAPANRTLAVRFETAQVTLLPGTTLAVGVPLTRNSGDSFPAQLTVLGLPADVSASFTPNPTSSSASMVLTAAPTAVNGTYFVSVLADGGGTRAAGALRVVVDSSATSSTTGTAVTVSSEPVLTVRHVKASVFPGEAATFVVTATDPAGTGIGGLTADVSNLPAGFTGFLGGAGTGELTLSLVPPASATTQVYDVAVAISGNGFRRVMGFPVDVNAAPGFGLSAQPTSIAVARGATATVRLTVSRRGGFSAPVTVTTSGLPPGVTAAITPDATGATVVVAASPSAPVGAFGLTLTGTSGAFVASVQVAGQVT